MGGSYNIVEPISIKFICLFGLSVFQYVILTKFFSPQQVWVKLLHGLINKKRKNKLMNWGVFSLKKWEWNLPTKKTGIGFNEVGK